MVAITIDAATDPIATANQTAAVASGTTTAGDGVAVSIFDNLGAHVGPITATVVGTDWSIAATNLSALADGTLIYEATATDGLGAKAFTARAATKNTGAVAYITEAEFREAVKDTSNLDANLIARSIIAASRRVDQITGRRFDKATSATPRIYDADSDTVCRVDDIATSAGIAVAVDWGNDGLYATPWTLNTDYVLTPENQLNGGLPWAYTQIHATLRRIFPPRWLRKRVQVTAVWGWPAVPDVVVTATTLLAVGFYKRPEAPFGIAGISDFGAVRVRQDPAIDELLADYTTGDSKFLIA